MPNWCSNELIVSGEGKEVIQFILDTFKPIDVDNSKCYRFSFEKYFPTPTYENGGVVEDWYNWRVSNWGCKWDCCDVRESLEYKVEDYSNVLILSSECKQFNEKDIRLIYDDIDGESTLILNFETPWGPPEGVYAKFMKDYESTSLDFSYDYYEPGMCFAGKAQFNKGVITNKLYVNSWEQPLAFAKYQLDNELEDIEYMIEYMIDAIDDCYLELGYDEKMRDKLFKEITNMMNDDNVGNLEKAKLYIDCTKNIKFCKNN